MLKNLVQQFHGTKLCKNAWRAEIQRRASGLHLEITDDFFFHTNPLHEPNLAMQYIVGRYEASYKFLATMRPTSILEIGCAHGLSTWLMTSWAKRVVGLDISKDRIVIGRHLFPEVEWVVDDWRKYLTQGHRFDVIVNSHGPVMSDPVIDEACTHYIYIGYRAQSWREALTGAHKLKGRQLSFSTTVTEKSISPRSPSYVRYFFRRNWLKEARHALTHGYKLPL